MIMVMNQINGLPIVTVDDYYEDSEFKAVMAEIDYLNYNNRLSKITENQYHLGAMREDGTSKTSKAGIFLNDIYGKYPYFSNIIALSDKIPNLLWNIRSEHSFFEYSSFMNHMTFGTLLSYYENEDYYEAHKDCSVATIIIWVYKEPKSFTGGELIINDELTIECKNNRAVILPGCLDHEVKNITMNEEDLGKGMGRISISHFTNLTIS